MAKGHAGKPHSDIKAGNTSGGKANVQPVSGPVRAVAGSSSVAPTTAEHQPQLWRRMDSADLRTTYSNYGQCNMLKSCNIVESNDAKTNSMSLSFPNQVPSILFEKNC